MKEQLKIELHQLIEAIEDEEALSLLTENAAVYALQKEDSNELSSDQLDELQVAMNEAEAGETISYEDFKKHTAERIKKLS